MTGRVLKYGPVYDLGRLRQVAVGLLGLDKGQERGGLGGKSLELERRFEVGGK